MILGLNVCLTVMAMVFSGYHIVRFLQYKDAQDYAPIKLPFSKIEEFYKLAPEKYSIRKYETQNGIFIYTPTDYMLYEKEYIMADNYMDWLKSLKFIKQIENNKISKIENTHTKDYLQFVLEDVKALQIESQDQINCVLGEMQKPPVDCIAAYCEGNRKEDKNEKN